MISGSAAVPPPAAPLGPPTIFHPQGVPLPTGPAGKPAAAATAPTAPTPANAATPGMPHQAASGLPAPIGMQQPAGPGLGAAPAGGGSALKPKTTGPAKIQTNSRFSAKGHLGRMGAGPGSAASGEGISLRGARLMQVLDPYWNQARSDQQHSLAAPRPVIAIVNY